MKKLIIKTLQYMSYTFTIIVFLIAMLYIVPTTNQIKENYISLSNGKVVAATKDPCWYVDGTVIIGYNNNCSVNKYDTINIPTYVNGKQITHIDLDLGDYLSSSKFKYTLDKYAISEVSTENYGRYHYISEGTCNMDIINGRMVIYKINNSSWYRSCGMPYGTTCREMLGVNHCTESKEWR